MQNRPNSFLRPFKTCVWGDGSIVASDNLSVKLVKVTSLSATPDRPHDSLRIAA